MYVESNDPVPSCHFRRGLRPRLNADCLVMWALNTYTVHQCPGIISTYIHTFCASYNALSLAVSTAYEN